MKTFKVSVLSAAILLVATGIGFGIAQADGTHDERPVLSFEDQQAVEGGTSLCAYGESRPVLGFEDQETLGRESEIAASGESRPVLSFEDQEDVQVAMLERRSEFCIRQ